MRTDNPYKKNIFVFVLVVVSLFLITKYTNENVDANGKHSTLYKKSVEYLRGKLVMEKPLPFPLTKQNPEPAAVIYILGGGQDSLLHRFRKASSLYHQGFSRKIVILNRPGITEYSPDLGRNLTNNEWAIRELEQLNVEKGDIEPVSVNKWFWGTLSEAKVLSEVIQKKGFAGGILVTSDYHTRRTFAAFSRYASTRSMEFYIYGSDDNAGLGDLLSEYVKLFLYENFVLPADRWFLESRNRNFFKRFFHL